MRTFALEILVMREFCKPIAKSNKQAVKFGLARTQPGLARGSAERIRLSNITGYIKINLSLFLDTASTIKFETNDPRKKKKMYKKKINACAEFSLKTSSIRKAKWPVTFVVSRWIEKKPTTFTSPATKDNNEAILRLCPSVLVLPMCLNIFNR